MITYDRLDQGLIADVALDKVVARMGLHILQIGQIPGIAEGVKVDDPMFGTPE